MTAATRRLPLATAIALAALAPPLAAQKSPPVLVGTWHVHTTASVPGGPTCAFEGSAELEQEGAQVRGPMTVDLVQSSGPGCPAKMGGKLEGFWRQRQLQLGMVLGDGTLGEAKFTGQPLLLLGGKMEVTAGPFAGTSGSWMANPGQQTAPGDISGDWQLVTVARVGGEPPTATCRFRGSAKVAQTGSDLKGDAAVVLADGPQPPCPAKMDGTLSGKVERAQIQMGMVVDGGLGQARFAGAPLLALEGAFQVDSGPFAKTTGTWMASPNAIFTDGFESGDLAAWSLQRPAS